MDLDLNLSLSLVHFVFAALVLIIWTVVTVVVAAHDLGKGINNAVSESLMISGGMLVATSGLFVFLALAAHLIVALIKLGV